MTDTDHQEKLIIFLYYFPHDRLFAIQLRDPLVQISHRISPRSDYIAIIFNYGTKRSTKSVRGYGEHLHHGTINRSCVALETYLVSGG